MLLIVSLFLNLFADHEMHHAITPQCCCLDGVERAVCYKMDESINHEGMSEEGLALLEQTIALMIQNKTTTKDCQSSFAYPDLCPLLQEVQNLQNTSSESHLQNSVSPAAAGVFALTAAAMAVYFHYPNNRYANRPATFVTACAALLSGGYAVYHLPPLSQNHDEEGLLPHSHASHHLRNK